MSFLEISTSGASFARAVLTALATLPFLASTHAMAQFPGRTGQGQISVAHVADLIARAGSEANARERLSFYLTSVAESAAHLLAQARSAGLSVSCTGSFSVGNDTAWAAISAGAPDTETWPSIPATPIIIDDLLMRAGC